VIDHQRSGRCGIFRCLREHAAPCLAATLFLPASYCFASDKELETIDVTAEKPVPARVVSTLGIPVPEIELPATVSVVSESDIRERLPDRPEEALQQTGALLPGTLNGGLSTALNARGFDLAGRLSYNGHPDIQRMFVRDLATVERIEVWKGHLSLLYGQGAPGATVGYVGKKPEGSGRRQVSASVGSFGQKRIEADIDSLAETGEGFAYRVVFAGQDGGTFTDNVKNDRQTLFGTFAWRYRNDSAIRLEVEEQRNQRPFSFGTVYAGGRFQYDRSYTGPQSHSDRRYDRTGLYWDHRFDERWSLHGLVSKAHVRRDEQLVGFWTILNPTTLSSYYRKLSDDASQQNTRLELRGNFATSFLRHQLNFGVERNTQHIDFSGPQNIGGFTIAIAAPRFDVDLDALTLKRRISREEHTETGAFVFDRVSIGDHWHLLAGVRRSEMRIDTDNGTIAKTATDVGNTAKTWGIVNTPNDRLAFYLSRSESFEANRGLDRFGSFIPPKEGRQYEAGVNIQDRNGENRLHLAFFDIEQSNLTTTDPLDPTALIAAGTVRSRGIDLQARLALGDGLALFGEVSSQQVRNIEKTDPTMGDELPGVPRRFGALTLEQLLAGSLRSKVWGTLAFVGRRQGDIENTFTAPAYGRLDLGASLAWDKATSFIFLLANSLDKRYVEAITSADNVYQGERRRLTAVKRHTF
jgi:iron complex outermembrane recepter protein